MLTQEALAERRRYVCATDIPILAGYEKYGNVSDLFIEKAWGVSRRHSNPSIEAGHVAEPGLVRAAIDFHGSEDHSEGRFCRHPNGYCAATPDLILHDKGKVIDAKAAIFTRGDEFRIWGDEGTDAVPGRIYVQVQWQLHCCNAAGVRGSPFEEAEVWALIADRGVVRYVVRHDPALCCLLQEMADRFWWDHVVPQAPPTDWRPDMSLYAQVERKPGKEVELDPDLVRAFLRGDEALSEDDVLAALAKQMGDARYGTVRGRRVIEAVRKVRRGYTVAEKVTWEFREVQPAEVCAGAAERSAE